MTQVGTCGFSYADWVGPFYPEGTRKGDMLVAYAQRFDLLELNATFYSILSQKSVESILRKAQRKVSFAVKAHRGVSHERDVEKWAPFRESIEAMRSSGTLGCVLVQFPFSFHNSKESRGYLSRLRGLADVPLVVEFRHESWIADPVFHWLRDLDLGFCCVDEPRLQGLMPPKAVLTSSLGYVRFHGRNAKKWWNHQEAWERYDYLYSEEELAEWVPKIREMSGEASKVFVFFNNHFGGKAAQNAQQLKELLKRPDA